MEIVNIRVAGTGPTAVIDPKKARRAKDDGKVAKTGQRTVYFGPDEGSPRCSLYDRSKLKPGHRVRGAAIIEQYDSTIVVPPWANASVDGYHNVIIERR